MIRSVRRHLEFTEIARKGTKVVENPFRLSALVAEDGDAVAMGYAIPRSVGSAVERNRLRRQLRAVFAELDEAGRLPAGSIVVSVRPHAPLRFSELRGRIGELVERLAATGRS